MSENQRSPDLVSSDVPARPISEPPHPPAATADARPAWRPLAAVLILAVGVGWLVWGVRDGEGTARAASAAGSEVGAELMRVQEPYVAAIADLEAITETGAGVLDPATSGVLEANLTVIDQAIDESRAALETQPSSDVAQDSLFAALRSKVVLLQETVALINEMRKGNEEGAARIASELSQ